MATKSPKNFVGHITFPYTQDSKEFFFYTGINKTIRRIYYGDVLIDEFNIKITQQKQLAQMLTELGYTIKDSTTKDGGSHISKTIVQIPCNNDDCRHYCERVNGVCKTNIKAKVDRIKKDNVTVEQNIVVSYEASDIQEVTKKSECLLWYIKENLGLNGEADVYGKMEMC